MPRTVTNSTFLTAPAIAHQATGDAGSTWGSEGYGAHPLVTGKKPTGLRPASSSSVL